LDSKKHCPAPTNSRPAVNAVRQGNYTAMTPYLRGIEKGVKSGSEAVICLLYLFGHHAIVSK